MSRATKPTARHTVPNGVQSAAVTAAALRVALSVVGKNRALSIGDAEAYCAYATDLKPALDLLCLAIDGAYPTFLDQPNLPLPPVDGGRCWICGCTDERACEEGCHWVDTDVCSRCATRAAAILATGRPRLASYEIADVSIAPPLRPSRMAAR